MSPPSLADLALRWQPDLAALAAITLTILLYAGGVRRLAAKGRRWAPGRRAAMAAALVTVLVATQSGIARYEATDMGVHMLQHMLLGLVVPLLVVLSAPITLALQASRPSKQRTLLRWLHSRPARLLAHPLVAWLLFGGGLVVIYLTSLLDVAARSDLVHLLVHAHVVVSGVLFLGVLIGVDPLPGRPPFAVRLLALAVAIPFHAVVGLALLSATSPVAPDAYPSLDDQRTAAGVFWGTGELFTLIVAAIVVRQWWTSEQRAAARETSPRLDHADVL